METVSSRTAYRCRLITTANGDNAHRLDGQMDYDGLYITLQGVGQGFLGELHAGVESTPAFVTEATTVAQYWSVHTELTQSPRPPKESTTYTVQESESTN